MPHSPGGHRRDYILRRREFTFSFSLLLERVECHCILLFRGLIVLNILTEKLRPKPLILHLLLRHLRPKPEFLLLMFVFKGGIIPRGRGEAVGDGDSVLPNSLPDALP